MLVLTTNKFMRVVSRAGERVWAANCDDDDGGDDGDCLVMTGPAMQSGHWRDEDAHVVLQESEQRVGSTTSSAMNVIIALTLV